ncbi:MAG: type I-U CRISPR-associated protein Cas7 [Thermoleophilia bacterium]|nr:type I-U CRISPR-associated protein Cas7 [Thermoleophilia bacterium]
MSNDTHQVTEALLNDWATKADGPVALRLKQRLLSVEESGIVFPPTYADIGYNIDTLSDGTRVATIDSVGSQANRLEPFFTSSSQKPEDWLVPQIEIAIRREPCGECEACKKNAESGEACQRPRPVTRSLLDLAHRAADAVVQSSPELLKLIEVAFKRLQQGNAWPLCTIAPTSLVFGVWDSRGDTGEKRPRLVRSIIRAWDVEPLHAAAQFNSVWKLLDERQQEELKKEEQATKTDLSVKGLNDAPATFRKTKSPQYRDGSPNAEARVLGGVLVNGRIERYVTVNLVALRGLRGANEKQTDAIRRYLLGLSLVAATADIELFLREGCLLRYAEDGDQWFAVPRRGEPTQIKNLTAEMALTYAETGATHFRPEWPKVSDEERFPGLVFEFNVAEAKKLLAKKTAEDESAQAAG